MPSNFSETATANGTATITWNSVPTAIGYELRYRPIGSTATPTVVSSVGNQIGLQGLMPNVCYEYRVRAQCDTVTFSDWAPRETFCVPGGSSGFCGAPTNISSTTTLFTASISWAAVSGAQRYELRYRVIGSTATPTFVYVTNPSAFLSNLMPNTCYEYALRTECDTNNVSQSSPRLTFCTSPSATCGVPANINSNTTTTSASINWGSVAGAQRYELRYRIIGSGVTPTYVYVTSPSAFLSGLMPGTCYEYALRTECDSINISASSPVQTFCTDTMPSCNTPVNISSSPATAGTTISWSPVAGAQSYELRYRAVGSTAIPTFVNTTTNSVTLTGLMPNVCYEFKVRTQCDTSNFSPLSPLQTFCVSDSAGYCLRPTNFGNTTTSNSATITWNNVPGANGGYEFRFRLAGSTVTPTYLSTFNAGIVLSNLMPNTCYEYAVRTVCDSTGNFSPWTGAHTFCTTDSTNAADTTNPVAVCRNITVYLNSNGVVTVSAQQLDGGSFDNVGIVAYYINGVINTSMMYNCTHVGLQTATLTVVDSAGNQSRCTATITVVDTIMPFANCTNHTAYLNPNGIVNVSASAINNGSFDNCSIVSLTINGNSSQQYTTNNLGANPATLMVTDASGNTASCVAIVTVVDSNTVPCPPVTNLMVDSIDVNYAIATWSDVPGTSNSYEIRLLQFGVGGYQFFQTSNLSYFLNNLTPATCYSLSVRTYCPGSVSVWADSVIFCTDSISMMPCNPPTFTSAFATTDSVNQVSMVNIYWNDAMTTWGYEVRYRPIGGTNYNFQSTIDSSILIRQLQPGTCYEYNVRTYCDSTIATSGFSMWSAVDTFCTPFLMPVANDNNDAATHQLDAFGGNNLTYQLFPNPTSGHFTVRFNQSLDTEDYTVRIFNVLGAEVTPNTVRKEANGFESDLSALPEGWYLVEIATAQQRWTAKVQRTR